MPDIDLFNFFRYMLGWVVTIYASIITSQSLYGWYIYLTGSDRYIGLLRRYVIVQSLRLRFKSFRGDLLICILLCVAFALLWRGFHILQEWPEPTPPLRHHGQLASDQAAQHFIE